MTRSYTILFSTLCAFMLFACKSDKNEGDTTTTETEVSYTQADIEGRWEILDAYHNNKRTELMSDLYFEFNEDGRLVTNLPESSKATYTLSGNIIQQRGSRLQPDYAIKEIKDSILVLNTELHGQPYRFYLKQTPPQVSEEIR